MLQEILNSQNAHYLIFSVLPEVHEKKKRKSISIYFMTYLAVIWRENPKWNIFIHCYAFWAFFCPFNH